MLIPTHILSPLSVALAQAMAQGSHFITLLFDGCALCRICSRTWTDVEAYAADERPCLGYAQCGQVPVPGAQPLSVGAEEERGGR